MLPYIVCLLAGYAAGSFPTAYILVRWKSRLDIRHAGSGNVGTMNTFDVTGSTAVTIAVLLIDMAKGALAVAVAGLLAGPGIWLAGTAGIGAVLGHNYPLWLKFHGGRGLAPAAGVFFMTGWVFVPLWLLLWGITYRPTRSIHAGNIVALVIAPLLVALAPDGALRWCVGQDSLSGFRILGVLLCGIIIIRHIDVLPAALKSFHH